MLQEQIGTFEDYLDGALDDAGRREVEAQVGGDARAARILAGVKSSRALRSRAMASYAPGAEEAAGQAAKLLAMCEQESLAPVAKIGPDVKRWAAVAAAVVVIAGAFMAGRTTAPVQTATVFKTAPGETHTVYNVAYTDPTGVFQVRSFDTLAEYNGFVTDLQEHGATGLAVAEYTSNGL